VISYQLELWKSNASLIKKVNYLHYLHYNSVKLAIFLVVFQRCKVIFCKVSFYGLFDYLNYSYVKLL